MNLYAQQLAFDWGVRCFGMEHMQNESVRALRLVEEAIEAAQACEVDAATLHKLIDLVYARPCGELWQELGGVVLTTGVLAYGALHSSLDDLFYAELRRCLSKSPEHFAKRNEEKLQLGLVGK